MERKVGSQRVATHSLLKRESHSFTRTAQVAAIWDELVLKRSPLLSWSNEDSILVT